MSPAFTIFIIVTLLIFLGLAIFIVQHWLVALILAAALIFVIVVTVRDIMDTKVEA